ncbi:MAG: TRAP transporter substrate-binding protein DctP [Pyrobaculum sp.]
MHGAFTVSALKRPQVLIGLLIALIVISGIAGYFAGTTTTPPAEVRTVTVTLPGEVRTVTVTITPAPEPTKVYRWRLVTHLATGERRAEAIHYFARLVRELSGGRLIIEVYGGGELFPVIETYTQLARGTIEAAATYTGYWAGMYSVMALLGAIPWPVTEPHGLWHYLEKVRPIAEKFFREELGLVYIGPLTLATAESLMCRIPITSVRELAGRIVRSSGIGLRVYELLGAKAITLPVGEIYTALQLGTVDCAEWNDYVTNYVLGFHEVAKYVLDPPPGMTIHTGVFLDNPLVVNPKAWEELPDDLKTVVRVAAQAAFFWSSYQFWGDQHVWGKELWIKAGNVIYTLPKEDWELIKQAQITALAEQAMRDAVALEMVKAIIEVARDLGYEDWASALEQKLREIGLI